MTLLAAWAAWAAVTWVVWAAWVAWACKCVELSQPPSADKKPRKAHALRGFSIATNFIANSAYFIWARARFIYRPYLNDLFS
jgi:hypothetical protein